MQYINILYILWYTVNGMYSVSYTVYTVVYSIVSYGMHYIQDIVYCICCGYYSI